MSTSHLGALPAELQLVVLSLLEDSRTLCALARVSRIWYAYAIDQLWARPPRKALKTLEAARPRSRRQFLADKIQQLSLQEPEFAFKALEFRSLQSLSFGKRAGSSHISHEALIQPSLRILSYHGEETFTPDSMKLVRQRCPNLHSLQVFDRSVCDSELFVDLLQGFSHLMSLSLGYRTDSHVAKDVLTCLAAPMSQKLKHLTLRCSLEHIDPIKLSHLLQSMSALRSINLGSLPSNISLLLTALDGLHMLEELELDHWITSEQISPYLQQDPSPTPFSSIRTLALQGDAQAVTTLLSSRSVTTLTLEVQRPDENFFATIGSMTQLQSLDITLPPGEVVVQAGLERLRTLSELRRINMSKSGSDDVLEGMLQLPWMTDELFEHFIGSYPLLAQLYLDWDLESLLTETSINVLAKRCPLLRRTMLMWQHDLEGWHKLKPPLLPNLEFLGLGTICHFASSSYRKALDEAEPLATMLRTLMPAIRDFTIFSSSVSADALSNTLMPGSIIRSMENSDTEPESPLDGNGR